MWWWSCVGPGHPDDGRRLTKRSKDIGSTQHAHARGERRENLFVIGGHGGRSRQIRNISVNVRRGMSDGDVHATGAKLGRNVAIT